MARSMGGAAQGIGNALLEEIVYDDTGNMLTATSGRFSAADLPAKSRGSSFFSSGDP